jgi:GH15 family glucan-1,4-alpha-glucosidase
LPAGIQTWNVRAKKTTKTATAAKKAAKKVTSKPALIEDYGVIGDLQTLALVSRSGSIDWLCWPHFDSPACLAALLGDPDNGRWLITPTARSKSTRRYLPQSLILETTHKIRRGEVTVTDCMPPRNSHSHIVRVVRGVRGTVRMKMELTLRFDYGRIVPWVQRKRNGQWTAICGPHEILLTTPVNLKGKDFATVSEFTVRKGDTVSFVLSHAHSHADGIKTTTARSALAETKRFWKEWCAQSTYKGEWKDEVERSLITLKALTFAPTGAIVAAGTASLPEALGGPRNWDYRYCWLRDATFTLLALVHAGHHAEADAWRRWLIRAVAGSPDLVQIMYTITGEPLHQEWDAVWLKGYSGSAPVRVGNAAAQQVQLDIYGEVLDALYHARRAGLRGSQSSFALETALLERLEKQWHLPDSGIWEVRNDTRHFTYSKVMAWVAFDRGIKMIEEFGLQGPIRRWKNVRTKIHRQVCRNAFHRLVGAFTQSYDSQELDSSALLLPILGFLPIDDPRITSTVAAIEKKLFRNGFLLRYDTHKSKDGLPAGEGVFLLCTFWLVDIYKMQRRDREARELFERLLSLRNDLGLLSEEYDPAAKRMLGNFPQAFSHIGLLNSAFNLSKSSGPAAQRSER